LQEDISSSEIVFEVGHTGPAMQRYVSAGIDLNYLVLQNAFFLSGYS